MENSQTAQEWEWLHSILDGDLDLTQDVSKKIQYLCSPNTKNPEFLLPLESSSSSAAALGKFNDNRRIKRNLKNLGISTFARSGFLQTNLFKKISGKVVQKDQWKLLTCLAAALGEKNLVAAVGIGPSRRNRKPVLQLLRPDGITVGFAKIGWSPLTKKLLENETAILKKLENKLPSWAFAPTVLHEERWGHTQVTVFTNVSTSFRSGNPDLTARKISQFAASLHTEVTPFEKLPIVKQWWSAKITDYIQTDKLSTRHRGKEICLGLWHGDLTPWNTSTVNGVTSIWDWEFAAENRPIGFDTLHRQFEIFRRDPSIHSFEALLKTEAASRSLLRELTNHPEAVFDLYLCELFDRELLLEGQKWESSNISPLLPALKKLLKKKELYKLDS